MAWKVKKTEFDLQTMTDIVHLIEPNTKAEHKLQFHFKNHCSVCGHVKPSLLDGSLDRDAHIEAEIEALNAVLETAQKHIRKHNIPTRKP